MFIGYRYRRVILMRKNNLQFILICVALAQSSSLFALETDRQQQMNIDANYQKTVQSQTNNENDPDITNLDGNVIITQGSLKATGDHAVIYKNASGVADESGNIGGIRRLVLTGKPAHIQQVHDIDCSLMTADALNIDYNNITGIAVLTKHVIVIQKGKSEFHGENMVYNTNTGEMESGDTSPANRVHMVIEPKTQTPVPATTNNCGFPGTPKPKTEKSATKH
jgi:lipopolysaccharide export system protein LptA